MQVPGVPYYFTDCPRPGGGYDPGDNIKPFFFQGHVPANYSGKQFEVRLGHCYAADLSRGTTADHLGLA